MLAIWVIIILNLNLPLLDIQKRSQRGPMGHLHPQAKAAMHKIDRALLTKVEYKQKILGFNVKLHHQAKVMSIYVGYIKK